MWITLLWIGLNPYFKSFLGRKIKIIKILLDLSTKNYRKIRKFHLSSTFTHLIIHQSSPFVKLSTDCG